MERSQLQNKNKALQMLKEKLYMMEQEANAEKLSGIQGVQKGINFGSQIRSYVLQPYTMVKDTRTDAQTSNAQAVLDGSIDIFINAYLAFINQKPEEQNGK
jgi:peptide chain release factor 2